MKEKFLKYSMAFAAMLILMLIAFSLGGLVGLVGYYKGKESFVPETETIVIHTTDTLRLPASPPDTVTLTKVKTVKVPLHDTVTLVDSVWVDLPFEQHFARLDSVADVWYSGYDAKIDSAIIYKHQQTIIEQHYITEPSKPNIIGIEAGARDASVMYMRQLGSFYVGISAGSTYEGTATAKGVVGIRF